MKGYDQYLLQDFFYKYAKESSIQHDSYSCLIFEGSQPFPTRRSEEFYCHVGCQMCCERNLTYSKMIKNHVCPIECRPKEHQDWIYC